MNPDADDPPFDPTDEPEPAAVHSAERAVLIAPCPKTGRSYWFVAGRDADMKAVRRVDVGRTYTISREDSLLRIDGRREGFTPDGLLLAAKCGWFGFRLLDAPVNSPPPKKAKVKR